MKQVNIALCLTLLAGCSSDSTSPIEPINEQDSLEASVSESPAQLTPVAPLQDDTSEQTTQTQTEPVPCVGTGIGWGWENNQSCFFVNTPEQVATETIEQNDTVAPTVPAIDTPAPSFPTIDPFIGRELACSFQGEPDFNITFNADGSWEQVYASNFRVELGTWDSADGIINQRNSRFTNIQWEILDGQIRRQTASGVVQWCGFAVPELEPTQLPVEYITSGLVLQCAYLIRGGNNYMLRFNSDMTVDRDWNAFYTNPNLGNWVPGSGTWENTSDGFSVFNTDGSVDEFFQYDVETDNSLTHFQTIRNPVAQSQHVCYTVPEPDRLAQQSYFCTSAGSQWSESRTVNGYNTWRGERRQSQTEPQFASGQYVIIEDRLWFTDTTVPDYDHPGYYTINDNLSLTFSEENSNICFQSG